MRELNECKAEVFRRSENRIKERRKNRNRVLACCISLCLIITLCSVTIFPAMIPAGTENASGDANELQIQGSIVCTYTEAEIQDAGQFPEHYEKVTDKVAVTNIFCAVHVLFPDADDANRYREEASDIENSNREDLQVADTAGEQSGYLITFSDEDGNQTVYNLNGDVLLNMNTGETVYLTDAQVAELKAALGISE